VLLYLQIMLAQLQKSREYFESGATKSFTFRKQQLQLLAATIKKYEAEISEALHTDLGKSYTEAYASEIALVQMEISFFLNNLRQLMQPKTVDTNLMNLPASSKIYYDALGIVLIIAPWNYPFQLLFNPLVGSIAGGNCVVLKPSEFTPATNAIAKKIVQEIFAEAYIQIIEGDGAVVIPEIMNSFRFNHVFFTGSTAVGKAVYGLAAKELVPVTLELGGKSPCVIEADANLKVAAKRIVMGKFINAGQTCIAPDYLLVEASIKEKFLDILKQTIVDFYTADASTTEDYSRIINEKRFDTLVGYLKEGEIVYGGKNDKNKLFIEPTILSNVALDAKLMTEEIFGPILPIFSFSTQQEALNIIKRNPNPLAFYVFTSSTKTEEDWINKVQFGGGCVNNTIYHITNHHLPFGGVGYSGIGSYHGHKSFEIFTHAKPVLKTATWIDPSLKYPPFKGKLKWFKLFLK
jgi:aldehyde dehydrogenase (NAD+)